MPDLDPRQLVRIGELSRRTGVRADTIRAWERRYGLMQPVRTERGYRLYSSADEAKLRAMRDLTGDGLAAAEAAAAVLAGNLARATAASASALDAAAEAERLRIALEAFDEAGANAVLDRTLAGFSLGAFTEEVALAAMSTIGERWESGEVSVAQEHFASSLLRGRLLGLARGWGTGAGPLAVLACLPGELHDLGLICFGLSLRERGWRIAYLGPDTPLDTLDAAVAALGPRVVVLSAQQPELVESVAGELRRLGRKLDLAVGGAGAARATPVKGVRVLAGNPLEAVEELAGPAA